MTHFAETNSYVSGHIRPKADNLLVRPEPPPKQPTGLIVAPDRDYTAVEGMWATVVAVGDGASWRNQCRHCHRPFDRYVDDVRPGDRVLLNSPTSGDVVYVGGVEHRIVRAAECELVDERAPRESEAASAA